MRLELCGVVINKDDTYGNVCRNGKPAKAVIEYNAGKIMIIFPEPTDCNTLNKVLWENNGSFGTQICVSPKNFIMDDRAVFTALNEVIRMVR